MTEPERLEPIELAWRVERFIDDLEGNADMSEVVPSPLLKLARQMTIETRRLFPADPLLPAITLDEELTYGQLVPLLRQVWAVLPPTSDSS
jgi:hypothetical protein